MINARIAWGNHVSDTFLTRVQWIVDDLQIGHDTVDGMCNLMSCMAWESGRSFKSNMRNMAGSGATGLIQFMPSTATALGTTTAKLALMTPEDQLNYVWKYFEPQRGKLKTLADIYMAILWPKGIGKPDSYTLWGKSTMPTTFRQNAGLDTNKDNTITKAEAAGKVNGMLIEGMKEANMRIFGLDVKKALRTVEDGAAVVGTIIPAVGIVGKGLEVISKPKTEAEKAAIAANGIQVPPYDAAPVAQSDYPEIQPEPAPEAAPVTGATGLVIAKAASGWQGNLTGAALIAGTLLTQPEFTRALAGFTLSLARGEGGWAALVALAGAALIAFKSKHA